MRAFDGEVDPLLSQTRWWLVPHGYHWLVDWYVARTPVHRMETQYDSGRTAPDAVVEWETHGRSRAYSRPVLVLAYDRLGRHRTAIRTDVTVAARADRTARTLVPGNVTRIAVTRRALDGPDAGPKTVTVTDPGHVNAVVNAFDKTPGEFEYPAPAGCASPVGIVYVYAVTFYWPGHRMVVDSGQPLCGVGRTLTRDDTKLPQQLADGTALDTALKAAFDSR
ncbi:MAG: hypothetical protein QM747_12950 [Nocardioides sp.]